jgi:hypothetical protein
MMKKLSFWIGLLLVNVCSAEVPGTVSPDGANRIDITIGAGGAQFSVSRKGETVIAPSAFGMIELTQPGVTQSLAGAGLSLKEQRASAGIGDFTLPAGKSAHVRAPCRQTELTSDVKNSKVKTLTLIARAYDDGVAFRYVIPKQPGGGVLSIQDELTEFRFPADFNCRGLNQGRFEHAFEGEYDALKVSQARPFNLFQAPFVCKTPDADVTRPKPEMDMAEIVRYAASKEVGVWVWLQWKQLERQMDQALPLYQQWGIKGIKVDFINRNDQEIMPFYQKLLSQTAEHKLMVDLHGAFPPAGLTRTYPHYLTQEGVLGAENNKWSRRITARHNIALAFTRGLLGPMDYTPGGFRHLTPAQFPSKLRFIDPYVMTTRGAALAMYVIFESPLQMVADSPAAYRKADGSWEDGVDFLKIVPTSWSETRFISGDLDDHVALARRSGDTWYVGAMTDKAKTVNVPLTFLGKGRYTARIWKDGATISTLTIDTRKVDRGARLSLPLAANGGAVVMIAPEGR